MSVDDVGVTDVSFVTLQRKTNTTGNVSAAKVVFVALLIGDGCDHRQQLTSIPHPPTINSNGSC